MVCCRPDPGGGGRARALEAARTHELRARSELPPARAPCAPPRGPPPRPHPECDPPAPKQDDDCPCEVKGACKKVRFSDEAQAAPDPVAGCTRVAGPPPPPARCDGDRDRDRDREIPATPSTRPEDKDSRSTLRAHAPCDCPCWAAYSPHPPASLATTDIYRTCRLPKRFQYPVWFSGYNTGPAHPLYRTTASDIGRFPPTVHTVNTIYRPVDRTVSKIYSAAGPWRNRSLCNTGSIWDAYSYHNFY
ncbi:UPF0691 protein C9orf116 [Frankliniella fusca]|uniref:UPF0691 protein C9orf116 n=1 Tax=Frankliniella fusca TaxID=407009 RepID=A0AAE1HT55_9NEOP|nr:UPF0691 protein C9orf116 [Frankliniella fusca]